MKFHNLLGNECESPFFRKAIGHLPKDFKYDVTAVVWSQTSKLQGLDRPYICLETSHEEHEITNAVQFEGCVAALQHYYPYAGNNPAAAKAYAMPLTYVGNFPEDPIIPAQNRKYDFAIMGQGSGHKEKFFWVAEQLKQRGYNVFIHKYNGWNNGLPTDEYAAIMRDTRFALCPHGTISPESFRLTEAMCAGCIIICEPVSYYVGIARYCAANPQIAIGIDDIFNWRVGMADLSGDDLSWFQRSRDTYDAIFSPEALAQRILRATDA